MSTLTQLESDRRWGARYESVQRWLREIQPTTKKHYLRSLNLFCQEARQDPDRFLAWAKSQDTVTVHDFILKNGHGLTESLRFEQRVAVRSFLSHNGYNGLPKMKHYVLKEFHRPYTKEEARKIVGYLDQPLHKLFAYILAETGLRSKTVLQLEYRHVKEDLESNRVPSAVRLEPAFHQGRKPSGFTFLGERSVNLLRDCIEKGLVKTRPNSPLVPLSYSNLYQALTLAVEKAGIDDPTLQPCHAFRKLFENSLDRGQVDPQKKEVLEGHFSSTRSKFYTGREWDELRPIYEGVYPFLNLESSSEELEKDLIDWRQDKTDLEKRLSQLETEGKVWRDLFLTSVSEGKLSAEKAKNIYRKVKTVDGFFQSKD